jgi:formamidopyrimidine-DNA glycosylase
VPELLEVEAYRRAAEATTGRVIESVLTPDPWFLKRGTTGDALRAALVGTRVRRLDRRGKLLLVVTDHGTLLGLRFGMTGRVLVDGRGPIERLEYGPGRTEPAWDRFGLRFRGGGSLVVSDPRRLGGVELDPDLGRIGPEAATVTTVELREALGVTAAPLKAVLLDQGRIAGLGNLLVDETLFRAGLDPRRPAGSLTREEVRGLARTIRSTVVLLGRRGGSHTGDLQAHRCRGGCCPRCGGPLRRATVGGRTTYWCPEHQH